MKMSMARTKSKNKFGVYIPPKLMSEINEFMKSMNIDNRSLLVQEATKMFIAENRWAKAEADAVAGAFAVLLDAGTDLSNTLCRYRDVVISTMSIPIDAEKHMLLIAVKGPNERVRKLIGEIHKVRGVLLVRPLIVEAFSLQLHPSDTSTYMHS